MESFISLYFDDIGFPGDFDEFSDGEIYIVILTILTFL